MTKELNKIIKRMRDGLKAIGTNEAVIKAIKRDILEAHKLGKSECISFTSAHGTDSTFFEKGEE